MLFWTHSWKGGTRRWEREECEIVTNSLSRFQLVGLDFPNAPCGYGQRTSLTRSHLDRIFCRLVDRNSISCPQFKVIDYTDYTFVIWTVDIDMIHWRGSGFWKLNASFLECRTFRNRVNKISPSKIVGCNRQQPIVASAEKGYCKEMKLKESRTEGDLS